MSSLLSNVSKKRHRIITKNVDGELYDSVEVKNVITKWDYNRRKGNDLNFFPFVFMGVIESEI